MSFAPQLKVSATYMRGGTSKGTFFNRQHLPDFAQQAGAALDHFLMRTVGSPDPYGKQIDGMGGASSSTSKAILVGKSERPNHDIDYHFAQVSIDKPLVDWSGNCGNLTAAVGAFAIHQGLVDPARIPQQGVAEVRMWQANISKTIIAQVPITNGEVQETGDFELDGVTFPAAEIVLEFIDPVEGAMLPTGQVVDELDVPGIGRLQATFINAGIPTIFVDAKALGYTGTELQEALNSDPAALEKLERIRAHGALKMGLISDISEAATRQHTPKLAWCAKPQSYTASSGKTIAAEQIDLCVRAMSMGKLHHAMMGTAAVSIAAAAAVPGTLVNLAAGGGQRDNIVFGHPSGLLKVGAAAVCEQGQWRATKVVMSRSARILMEGTLRVTI